MKDYNEIKDSSTSLKSNSQYREVVDKIRNQCKVIISKKNYTDSNNCVKECLEISETINEDFDNDLNECGLSNNLVIWILNIIKWVKYIIPVIVILMGILDFIRAVASDKDDGMKKAQSRFVKRLIAAALIFVVPFILEFILEKFGFSVKDCGLELFK